MTTFVITSEYTRRIAHELDGEREKWLNIRSDLVLDYLPADINLLVPPGIDHARYLSDKVNLNKHYADSNHDEKVLQLYLGELKGKLKSKNFRINGRAVSHDEFFAHRELVLRELCYKKSLTTRLKQQIRRQNIMRSEIEDGAIDGVNSNPLPEDVEIIRNLYSVIKGLCRARSAGDVVAAEMDINTQVWLDRARDYVRERVEVYLWDIDELYPDETQINCATQSLKDLTQ